MVEEKASLNLRQEVKPQEIRKLWDFAETLAAAARGVVKSKISSRLTISEKADKTLVTDIDTAIEAQLRSSIENSYPEHGIVGEELALSNPEAEFQWFLDPIDGTEELVHGVPLWGTIIALHFHNQPLLGIIDHPQLDFKVSAALGFGTWVNDSQIAICDYEGLFDGSQRIGISRRSHFLRHGDKKGLFDLLTRKNPNFRTYASCYNYVAPATGRLDAGVDWHVRAWDRAATQIIIEEAGGKFVSIEESSAPLYERRFSSVFGKPRAVDYLVALIKR